MTSEAITNFRKGGPAFQATPLDGDRHHHDPEFRFCPLCGGGLNLHDLKAGEPRRLVCDACGFVFFLDPKVVACTVVEHEGRIVLLKRSNEPQKGKWVMPGGYVDRGETIIAAAERETLEECRLRVEIGDLVGVYSYPGRIAVVVVYRAEYKSGDLRPEDETLEAAWFSRDDIPWADLAFQSTSDALKDYFERKRNHADDT